MMADVGGIAECQRQKDRNTVCAAQSRKNADDDAEDDANDHHHDVEGLQRHREAPKKIGDFFHLVSPETVADECDDATDRAIPQWGLWEAGPKTNVRK